jgi:hypothetical protein
MTPEQKEIAMMKNGISSKDLQEAYNKGYNAGVKKASDYCLKDAYAGFLLAAHEVFGFGRDRCRRLLYAADDKVVNSLASDEAIDEVFKTVGVSINFFDPDRITEVLEGD